MDIKEIADEKPTAQAVIARNLAQVLDRFKDNKNGSNGNQINFNVFIPRQHRVEEFGEPVRVIETTVKR